MSCVCYCDEDDCQNNDNNCTMYDISYKIHEPLRNKIGRFHQHICKDCVDWWNSDYTEKEPLIIEDNIYDIILNEFAKKNNDE